MAGTIHIPDDLAANFGQFQQIAALVASLHQELTNINLENHDYAGHDRVGRAYHIQLDQPTTDLGALVTSIQQLLGLTGETGSTVALDFRQADADGAAAASSW